MPRAIWSGSISFGLVNVPIKVVTAVSQKEVRFHNLHDKDGARLRMKRVCSADGEEVPYENIVKGFEISPDEYVVIQPEELEALDPENTRMIDIEEFVDLADIDPIYYDRSYYLLPSTGGSKAYRVLADAMRSSGKVALGRVVLRTKQYLVALRPMEDALVMTTLNYADEVVDAGELDGLPRDAVATDRELKMAQQLIEALSGPFEPSKYHDEHREKVLELIEAKAEGAEVVSQPAREEPNPVVDLMAALQQSLKATKAGRAAPAAAGTRASNGGSSSKAATAAARNGGAAGAGPADGANVSELPKRTKKAETSRAAAARRTSSRSTKVGSGSRGKKD